MEDHSLTEMNTTAILPSAYLNALNFFFNHVYLLLLIIAGGIGNGFVIVIFGQRALRSTNGPISPHLSSYPFLFYMAISDTLYLLILFCLWLSNHVNILHRPVICQATLYVTYVCNFISAYFTVAFTVQRLFAVVQPFRVSLVLSWSRSRSLALFTVVVACLIYSYLLFTVGIVDSRCFSLERWHRLNSLMDVLDSILVFLIPYVLIITMNTFILLSLRRMRPGHDDPLFHPSLEINRIRELTRRCASRKMTQLLLTVSTSYLIICGPYASVHAWRLLKQHEPHIDKLLRQWEYYFHLIYHLSFAMNFYIYIVFGSRFRRELKRVLYKCKIHCYRCLPHEHVSHRAAVHYPSTHLLRQHTTDQHSTCPSLSAAGFSFTYKWKHSDALYM